jgi:hypothetical protein
LRAVSRQGPIRRSALALVLLAVAATAAPAHAAKGMEVALQDDGIFLYRAYYKRDRAFQQSAPLAVTRVRVLLQWASALGRKQAKSRKAPAVPVYYLKKWDDAIDAAAAHGVRVELTLTGHAPAFATSNHKIGPKRPSPRLFGEFARAMAAHFKGRVDRYSIWNEPNYSSWLAPMKKSANLYRGLYLAGYGGIKAADPAATVLMGETAPYALKGRSIAPLAFLRRTACVTRSWKRDKRCAKAQPAPGGALQADGFAHHPYDFTHAPTYRYPGSDNATIGTLGRLTSALDKLRRAKALVAPGGHHMTVYLTEFGYFRSGRRKISEPRRAKYLKQAFSIAARNRRVREMLQYYLVEPPHDYPGSFFNTGIVSLKGKPRKPYRSLAKWAESAAKKGAVAKPGGRIALPKAQPSGDSPPGEPVPPPSPGPLLPPLPPLPP